jgi:hypothetical protein
LAVLSITGNLDFGRAETLKKQSVAIRNKGATLASFAAANRMQLLASAKQSIRFLGGVDGILDMV